MNINGRHQVFRAVTSLHQPFASHWGCVLIISWYHYFYRSCGERRFREKCCKAWADVTPSDTNSFFPDANVRRSPPFHVIGCWCGWALELGMVMVTQTRVHHFWRHLAFTVHCLAYSFAGRNDEVNTLSSGDWVTQYWYSKQDCTASCTKKRSIQSKSSQPHAQSSLCVQLLKKSKITHNNHVDPLTRVCYSVLFFRLPETSGSTKRSNTDSEICLLGVSMCTK